MSYLVTAGPPTPNGDLHLGHLAGPYLAGDILTRYLRMTGERATYISAGDDHQSYVARMAKQEGRDPATVAAENGARIRESLASAGIALDLFASPAQSPRYSGFIERFFRTLLDRDALEERTTDQPFCTACDRFAFEAHLRGRCSHCDAESDGGICEACGKPNAGADLVDPACVTCGGTPERRPLRQLWFPLERYRSAAEFTLACAWLPPRARALVAELLAQPLPDVPATQPAEWGIAVPASGYDDQRISAWFELGPHYLALTDLLPEARSNPGGWQTPWTGFDNVVQCFGFDSIYFHVVLFPAIFQAFDPRLRPPIGFITNEFFRLDGKKFSTSRGHALWAGAFLRDHDADALRFHLARVAPEIEQTNFTLDEFEATRRDELIGIWDDWLIDLAKRCEAAGGMVPLAPAPRSAPLALARLASLCGDLSHCYSVQGFSPSRAAHLLSEIVRVARRFRAEHAVFDGKPASTLEAAGALAVELAFARGLALAAAPILPGFADRLWRDLGERGAVAEARWELLPAVPTAGTAISLSTTGYFDPARPGSEPAPPEPGSETETASPADDIETAPPQAESEPVEANAEAGTEAPSPAERTESAPRANRRRAR